MEALMAEADDPSWFFNTRKLEHLGKRVKSKKDIKMRSGV